MREARRFLALNVLLLAAAGCAVRGARTVRADAGGPARASRAAVSGRSSPDSTRTEDGQETGRPGERGEPPNDWFVRQRMSAGEPVPPRAQAAALEEWRARRDSERAASALGATAGTPAGGGTIAPDAPGAWSFAGPVNIGGRVTTLGIDPNDPNTLWLGAANGGVWKSTDGGVNWSPTWTPSASQSIGALVVHPTDSTVVYVGTGEDNGAGYSYDGDGVYKTVDGGTTWTNVGLSAVRRIGKMAIGRQHPDTVFVAAGGDVYNLDGNRGVFRTTDGGTTWTQVLFVANDTGAIDVVVDPSNDSNVYAATWTRYSTNSAFVMGGIGSAIYKSGDGGTTWSKLTTGLPASSASIGRIGLAISKSNPSILYAWYSNFSGGASGFMGIYKTANGGSTWSRADTCSGTWKLLLNSYEYYFGQIRVDPSNPAIVYLLEVDWFKSTNSACGFSDLNTVHTDFHDQAFASSSKFYFANDAGFYATTNTGSSFTHAATLGISQFYDLGIDPNQPQKRFGGLQDNNVVKTPDSGMNDWVPVIGGDGLEAEVDPTNSSFVYGESQYGNIARSTDGGVSFVSAVSGIGTERTNWKAPLTHDPGTSGRLYTGTIYVYRSVDGAQSWSIVSPNLTNQPVSGFSDEVSLPPGATKADMARALDHLASVVTHTTTAIGVSPVNPSILWVGTDDGNVWVSTNQGGSWTQVDIPGHAEWVTRVRADPFDANAAYATLSGYRMGSKLPHLFRTTDLGNAWVDISAGLPDVPLNCVVPDPQWKGRLFVCSDLGVYETDDWGVHWSAMNGGLPPDVVEDLNLVQGTRTLFAGTHGRSMWTYDLAQLPPPDRDGDGVINVDDCAPDDPGAFALPAEVNPLVADKGAGGSAQLSWASLSSQAGSGTVYDVARGDLAQLSVSGTGTSSSLACAVAGPAIADSDPLPSGSGVYYMVRGRDTCGTGSWGRSSQGADRSSAACP